MRYLDELTTLLRRDSRRIPAMRFVRAIDSENCWIGAGFVRDAVWDYLHQREGSPITGDVDVILFNAGQTGIAFEAAIELKFRKLSDSYDWSVKNQARMHIRNGDAPYRSLAEAMSYWPETATAVAVRLASDDRIDVMAPFGLDDLFELRLQPTPRFRHEKRHIFQQRLLSKRWLSRYPLLKTQPDSHVQTR